MKPESRLEQYTTCAGRVKVGSRGPPRSECFSTGAPLSLLGKERFTPSEVEGQLLPYFGSARLKSRWGQPPYGPHTLHAVYPAASASDRLIAVPPPFKYLHPARWNLLPCAVT